MGHADVARLGHAGHGVHIASAVPAIAEEEVHDRSEVNLAGILSPAFWEDARRQSLWRAKWGRDNPNGDWIASGHLFKVLYAFNSLTERIPDEALVERCAAILLERYFHPDVTGG